MKGMSRIAAVVLVVVGLLLALGAVADAQGTREVIRNLYVNSLTVATSLTSNGPLAAGAANFTGNVTTDGTFSADGTITTQAGLSLIPGTAISVTDGSTITPTTAIQELTAAGNVGASLAACGDGQVLTLLNLSNVTITITDTGTIKLSGNATLGQWDSLSVVGSGVTCVEVARANN